MAGAAMLALTACGGLSGDEYRPDPQFAAALPPPTSAPVTTGGAIFQASAYQALASGRQARQIGDILTVRLIERTRASKSQGADASRSSSTAVTLPGALPSFVPRDALEGGSSTDFDGSGSANQQNSLSGDITVTVADVLPNGVLKVRGEKRVQVSRGEEYIRLSGLVRPSDIGMDNSVPSTRVADARITYAGTGQVAAASKQGWLQRFFTSISPF
ncbi:flagellar basal body L-ring protein FlgH [Pacificimonas sp. WHA3]|uniref:Flagellar L-ring protein n=2 Tax=Pacificimonas pallii TaxID=2827236 RepID=A0ABS6SF47_9SPHN|nr:flagellar basal body L-ring protein FlgH [Pacificimonas pallii]